MAEQLSLTLIQTNFWQETAPKEFDPDKFLADTAPKAPEPGLKERAIRAGLNTLPTVGMITGGILATPETLGIGTAAGAALGAGAGTRIKKSLAKNTFK